MGRMTTSLMGAVALLLFCSVGGWAATVTVDPAADTYLDEDSQNTNYGSSYYLEVAADRGSGNPDASTLLMFNLPSLPPLSVINSARVLLYYCNRYGWTDTDWMWVGLYAVEPNSNFPRDWKEMEATWNQYKSGANWAVEGCESIYYDREANYDYQVYFDYYTQYGYKTWYVTDRVRMWYNGADVNRGWLARTASNNDAHGLVFYSREYSSAYRPKLIIDYTIIPEPASMVALGTGLCGMLALARRRKK